MNDHDHSPAQTGRSPFSAPVSAPPPGPSFTSPRWCPNQHPVSAAARFCDACGAPVGQLPVPAAPPELAEARVPGPSGPLTAKAIVVGALSAALVSAVLVSGVLVHLTRSSSPVATTVVPAVAPPTTTTVTGTLTLDDFETAYNGCVGQGGYSDIGPGATVILTDESGKILGASSLGAGSTTDSTTCAYAFAIPDVPQDAVQYAVEVTHRGKVVDSRQDLEDSAWTFALTLGS